MEWLELELTWHGLTALIDIYKPSSEPFAILVESRRIVEIEMREQGFEEKWEQLSR